MFRSAAWRSIAAAVSFSGAVLAASEGVIQNDTLWLDTEGRPILCNGGNMIREGGTFYWVGYDTAPRHRGEINLYASEDLAAWRFVGTIIKRTGEFGDIWWAGRPSLVRQPGTGKYVCIFEADGRGWKHHKIAYAVADRIDGEYHLANLEYPEPGRSVGDISVYQEGDRAYVMAAMHDEIEGKIYLDRSMAIFELRSDFLGVKEKLYEGFRNVDGKPDRPLRQHTSREAPHIVKKDGVYYWFSSALVGWKSSETMYATATDLAGPWSELKLLATEPRSTDSFNTQHDLILPIEGPAGVTYLYVGDRYSQWTGVGVGQNVFLPLEWREGVPVLVWKKSWSVMGPGR
ncbi:MAG: family 43 glycosylhydrolase [Phycisphaeraceae bacterium]|nr:family 43 glycosylhydrolase [Phycisphaeraceae bacterium]